MHHCGKTRVWYLRSTRSSFFSLVISADKHHTYKRCKWSKDRNTIGSHKIHFVDVNPPMAYLTHRKTHVVNLASSCGLWFQFKTQQVLCLVTREAQTHQKKTPNPTLPITHTHPVLMLGVMLWNKHCGFGLPLIHSHSPSEGSGGFMMEGNVREQESGDFPPNARQLGSAQPAGHTSHIRTRHWQTQTVRKRRSTHTYNDTKETPPNERPTSHTSVKSLPSGKSLLLIHKYRQ